MLYFGINIEFDVFFYLDDEEMEAGDDDEEMEAGDDDDEEEEEDPTLPSQVKSGEISSNVLNSKVIHISKLPKSKYYYFTIFL